MRNSTGGPLMLSTILSACVPMAITVLVHVAGIAVLLRGLMTLHALPPTRVWLIARMLLRMMWWLILIHLAEVLVWGMFYLWSGCVPNAETAFYFSGVTYTTIGYGDVVLAKPWRILGPIEGLMGILMCGLSAGYLFAVTSHIYQSRHKNAAELWLANSL
jgi:Ion channel